MLIQRLESVQLRIEEACKRAARSPSDITLVGVTKGVSAELIDQLASLGIKDIGENRVQEARNKKALLASMLGAKGGISSPTTVSLERIRWHMIGHLQRNKAKRAVELFDVIHSLDSVMLTKALECCAAGKNRNIDVFIQVNVSGEASKFGCSPAQLWQIADAVIALPHLNLCGLMTIAPFSENPQSARLVFRQLRKLRDQLEARLSDMKAMALKRSAGRLLLSMGMSADFEVAIEEGADIVRIGSAIFGSGKAAN